MALVDGLCFFITLHLYSTAGMNNNETGNSNDPNRTLVATTLPVHSMHRLIPSILGGHPLDPTAGTSIKNRTDGVPFLPSGMNVTYRSTNSGQFQSSNLFPSSKTSDFSPSFFIGEVIPEPYYPERLQGSRIVQQQKNSTGRSFSYLAQAPSAFAYQHVLPSSSQEGQYEHHPQVHEPHSESEDTTTPRYMVNYGDDQHSDRPSYLSSSEELHSLQSTKPIKFEDNYPDTGKYIEEGHYSQIKGQSEYGRGKPLLEGNHFPYQNSQVDSETPNPEEHLHHDQYDYVVPSPLYPPAPKLPLHQKDVHYKVYQNKPANPLKGLLHFAAALIPLGLFVAALQPNVLRVNSSQTIPTRQRSLDRAMALPGLEAMEKLGFGSLDNTECEKKIFCELAVLGSKPDGNTVQQSFWNLANGVPDKIASSLGLNGLFQAIRINSCEVFVCPHRDSFTTPAVPKV